MLEQQPDLLLIQELDSYHVRTLLDQLDSLYPAHKLHFTYEPQMRQAVISRYPLTPLEVIRSEGRAQKVIVHAPGQNVLVVNVHFSQPRYWRRHYGEMTRLLSSLKDVELPLLVGGDFNTTDQSEVYRMLDNVLDNAHWQAGWGFGFTFPADKRNFRGLTPPTPVIRIDHIFHNDRFLATAARTLSDSGGSDHFPVIAELELVD
jgi:vancomycin resistance protein VanJ